MGRKMGALVAAAALVLLGACGPDEDAATVRYTYTPQVIEPAPVRPAYDAKMCEQFEAQKDINARLAADGYADSYADEWDKLLRAAGC